MIAERLGWDGEQAIRHTIRNVDAVTRYGERHFLVILLGAAHDEVQPVMNRVFRGYYKMNGSGMFSSTYTVANDT